VAKGPGGIISGGFDPLKQSDGTGVSATASAAGTTTVTLTAGGTTTFAAQAISDEYGPGAFSGFGNSTSVFSGQELYAWGNNDYGQLNNNNRISQSSPTQIGSATTWSTASTGRFFSFGVSTSNELYSWGLNNNGQLGHGDSTPRSSPVQVGALTNWELASGGEEFSLAIKTDGTLWAWGRNDRHGELGLNDLTNRNSPVQVGSLTNWSSIAPGGQGWAAVKTDGTLWTCGQNTYGNLGINSGASSSSSPVQVGSDTDWSTVKGGADAFIAVKTSGELYAWGRNFFGMVGDNTTANRSSPVQVGALTNWSSADMTEYSSAAVKTDGTLWTWGANGTGDLGQNDAINRSSPVQVGSDTDWSSLATGDSTVYVLKSNGSLYAFGRNDNGPGQIGDNTTANRSSPVQIGSETSWSYIHGGSRARHAVALFGTTS